MPSLEMQGAVALKELFQTYLPRLEEGRLGFELMPKTAVNETKLIYERRGVYRGLQSARGIGGATSSVNKPNVDQYEVDPGYYGDNFVIDETELTNLRQIGDLESWDTYEKQSARAFEQLGQRMLDRQEYSIFEVMRTGTFTSKNAQGVVLYQPCFNVATSTPGTLFSDLANSAPLAYFRTLIQTSTKGVSVSFKPGKGRMLLNSVTMNLILANTNAADIGGKRLEYGKSFLSREDVNTVFAANDLPDFEVYDKGYYPDGTGAFTYYIPDNVVLVIGSRDDGEPIGQYRMTRHAMNGGGTGEWEAVRDLRDRTPPSVLIETGHNGGPVPFYTEAFVAATVA
jgi:hypothetical protein